MIFHHPDPARNFCFSLVFPWASAAANDMVASRASPKKPAGGRRAGAILAVMFSPMFPARFFVMGCLREFNFSSWCRSFAPAAGFRDGGRQNTRVWLGINDGGESADLLQWHPPTPGPNAVSSCAAVAPGRNHQPRHNLRRYHFPFVVIPAFWAGAGRGLWFFARDLRRGCPRMACMAGDTLPPSIFPADRRPLGPEGGPEIP